MTYGLLKGSLLVLIVSLYWKKRYFKRAHQNPDANVTLAQKPHFGLWDIPLKSKLVFHAVKYENTLTCKRVSRDSGADTVLKIFFYFLYI